MSKLLLVLFIFALLLTFAVCSMASYVGFGIHVLGREPGVSVRSGSSTGPGVRGGGPGSGK